MSDGSTPRTVLGLCFPTEEERIVVALGRCRDHALCAAATAVMIGAEGVGGADAAALRNSVDAYRTALGEALTDDVERRFHDDCAADFAAARRFAGTLDSLDDSDTVEHRTRAVALLEEAREVVLPALRHLTDRILEQAAKDQNAVLDALQSRNDELEGLFVEMERIGRMIHLVALNAAVEGARASGASGRAFGVIATEVQHLAGNAATLLGRARRRLGARPH